MKHTIGAIVLAAGRGARLQNTTPKAYVLVHGKMLIRYALDQFARCSHISEIVAVIHPDDVALFREAVRTMIKPTRVVHGGVQRQDSALAGVLATTSRFVLVHDAARPLVSMELIERVIDAMQAHGAAVPGVAVSDSLKRVSDGLITADLDRSEIVRAQTPQGFQRTLLLSALESACEQNRYFDDEAGAMRAMSGVGPKIVLGDEQNIKITTTADLRVAECWLRQGGSK